MSQKNNIFGNNSLLKVAELIFKYPNKSFHLREFARMTNLSTTAISASLKILQKNRLILVNTTKLSKNIQANQDFSGFKGDKLIFNLILLKKTMLIENLISLYRRPEAIVLFGSYGKGEDIEERDADLLILSSQTLTAQEKNKLDKLLSDAEKELSRKINLHVLQNLGRSESEFKNAAANGIVLHGYLKVV